MAASAGALEDAVKVDRGTFGRPTLKAYAVITLAVAAMMTSALSRPMMLHDSFWIDHVWAAQFTVLLGDGTLYPRWLPWSHDGLGSPVFYYYPPLAFYVTGLFGLAGLSTYGSILAAFALAFLVSGIGAYQWLLGRSRFPLLGALFFALGPYHWYDFYMRGALAESIAIALLPLLALGLRRVAEGRSWIFAAVAYAAMIASHLPLALLASLFFIVPYALLHRRRLAGFAKCCSVGIGLAAIYLLPAIALEPYRDGAQLWAMPHLRPTYWSIFVADWSNFFVRHTYITIATLLVPALIVAFGTRDRWAFYALGILALAAGIIPFVWSLPLLRDVQFPYRVLPLAELAIATAIARAPISPILRVAAIGLPLAWAVVVTQLAGGLSPNRGEAIRRHIDVAEYMPPGVQQEDRRVPWLDEPRAGRIPPPAVEGWIVRPTFYFPAWSCGQPEPRTKLLMHRPSCTPRLELTAYEKIGGLISLLSLLIIIAQSVVMRTRRGKPSTASG
ncbi:MAG: 6-pyruvoyl-tetrahydropterin synthase-related protein [Pseudomonadota bacterium]|nr:6-pyruvoyl-tetrahydropterin synthase-related protein [Pseudomonadota bacterium]